MTKHTHSLLTCLLTLLLCGAGGCSRQQDDRPADAQQHPEDLDAAAMPTNRVAIPPAVRSNLGISFVAVERRRVEQTIRVPGRFEYLPTARREYRTMLPGRIELLVDQFDAVQNGTPLYRIDSPAWRELQQRLTDAEAAIQRFETRLRSFAPLRTAHRAHEQQLEQTISIRRERVQQLERLAEAGGGRAGDLLKARDEVSTAEAELAEVLEKEAQLEADEAETHADLQAALARKDFLLDTASALLREPVDQLTADIDSAYGRHPRWRAIDTISVKAELEGVVESIQLTNGAWATEEVPVLTVVQPNLLRFHASGLQSDLGALRDGLRARIVPPTPTTSARAIPLQDTMLGELRLGLSGDTSDRTIDLYVLPESLSDWARPGVTAHLEIVTDTTAQEELAIPLAAVQRDGLMPIIFKRAPDNPNQAIRIEADLGPDDGRWVVIRSSVGINDEIVLDGAFQLMLATSGSIQKGGHFHSDGTYHAEDH